MNSSSVFVIYYVPRLPKMNINSRPIPMSRPRPETLGVLKIEKHEMEYHNLVCQTSFMSYRQAYKAAFVRHLLSGIAIQGFDKTEMSLDQFLKMKHHLKTLPKNKLLEML